MEKETGTVKWFNGRKGYGFINRDGGGEIFVHYSAIEGSGFRTLLEGQRVEFRVAEDSKGPCAVDVRAIVDGFGREDVPSSGKEAVEDVGGDSISMSKRLCVSNLSPLTSESRLTQLFGAIGEVASVYMAVEHIRGRRHAFALVDMAEENAAGQAVRELHGEEVEGQRIEVRRAGRPQFRGQ